MKFAPFLPSTIRSFNFSYSQLLLYGVQVGHSFTNSVFYAAWLMFSYCQEIIILNLYKTFLGMRAGLISLGAVCKMGGPIWFINLDPAAGVVVRSHAKFCGEFSVTSIWINGLISNYNGVYNTFMKFKKFAFNAFNAKNKNIFDIFKPWYFTRGTWPRAIFISSIHNSYSPTKEALQLSVPCLGITDSNVYTHIVSIPIPGNDESVDCLVFYNDFMAQYILSQKYLNITSWFFNIRKGKRALGFKNWIFRKGLSKKRAKGSGLPVIKFNFNFIKHFSLGMRAFLSQNKKYSRAQEEHIKVFDGHDIFNKGYSRKASNLFLLLAKSRAHFVKITNISGYQKSWFVDKFIYTRFLRGTYLKRNLLNKKFLERKLITDRFYKTHLHWRNLKKIFISKFLKFFLFYNFMHYTHLTGKKVYPSNANFLGAVYFRAIAGFFLNPKHPFPVVIRRKKEYTKHFGPKFLRARAEKGANLIRFKKFVNFKLSPRVRRKRRTFRQNSIFFNQCLKFLFSARIAQRMVNYLKFMRLNLPYNVYKKNKQLIKFYYMDALKEKLAYISPKFIENPCKSNNIKKEFFFKIKKLLNKNQIQKLNEFINEEISISDRFKKYTYYKHNKYFPKIFLRHPQYAKAYQNFIIYIKFFVLKNKKFNLPNKFVLNLKAMFQKIYNAFKLNYLKRNWYLTNLEKFKAIKLGHYKKSKAKLASFVVLNNLKRCEKKLPQNSLQKTLRNLKAVAYKLVKKNKLSAFKAAAEERHWVQLYGSNYKRPLKFNLINYKNNEFLTRFSFLKIFKRYKGKFFRANFAYRLDLLKNLILRRQSGLFYLRDKRFLKQALKNLKVNLGWFVFNNRFKIKFFWKTQKDQILFPRWYFINFPTALIGNQDFYTRPFKRINFFFYKSFNKLDSSLNKFFYLFYYHPYVFKFSCVKAFLGNYPLKHKSRGFKIKLRDVFSNNLNLRYKNMMKIYAYAWV